MDKSVADYDDIESYGSDLMEFLMNHNILGEDNPEHLSSECWRPIAELVELVRREPERENEVQELLDKHIREFFRTNRKQG